MTARQLALCGVLTALAASVLMLGGMIPAATFAAPLLAMALLLPLLEEYGPRAAGTAYAAAALLGLLLAADRETALVYLFFGWYPLVRRRIAQMPSKLLRALVRLAVCNAAILLLYGVVLRVLGLDAGGEAVPLFINMIMLVMGNLVFFLMDACLFRLTNLWHQKLRRRFFR